MCVPCVRRTGNGVRLLTGKAFELHSVCSTHMAVPYSVDPWHARFLIPDPQTGHIKRIDRGREGVVPSDVGPYLRAHAAPMRYPSHPIFKSPIQARKSPVPSDQPTADAVGTVEGGQPVSCLFRGNGRPDAVTLTPPYLTNCFIFFNATPCSDACKCPPPRVQVITTIALTTPVI